MIETRCLKNVFILPTILIYLSLFIQRFDYFSVKQERFPQSRMAALQTCNKTDNLDQKCYHMTLSERKN